MELQEYNIVDALDVLIDYRGRTPKKSAKGIPTLSAKSVKMGYIDYNQCYYISKEEYDSFMVRGFPQKGDILFTTEAPLGVVAKLDRDDVAVAQRLLTLRGKKGVLDNDFLLYYLQSSEGQQRIMAKQSGSTVMGIRQEEFRKINILIPSYEEQKKIASVLSALDEKIALNKKMNKKLEAMAKRLYDYWFVQHDFPDKNGHPYKTTGGPMTYNPTLKREIPEGWEVKKVSDYADLITKGTTPSTLGFDFQDVGINFVKVECIENGQIRQENLMHISEEAHDAMKRSQLHGNDILVTIAGRLGSAAIVSEHILPANTNQAVALIRMKKEYGHLVNYIYRVISSSSMQKRLQGSNAQSIQKNLTLPILGDIEFVQDSNCEIIKRFNEITKPIFLRQQENIQEISRLTALRDKLLPLLMNGQVMVG